MNQQKLNVAVAGLGGRGRYLARAFNEDPRTRLVAVYDTNPQALKSAQAMFGDSVAYYHDQAAMCAQSDFQIGVVASWDRAHHDNAINFLEHGVHVYLEKPMAALSWPRPPIMSPSEGTIIFMATVAAKPSSRVSFSKRERILSI